MSRPWMKWYPKDWRADARLRMCSLAARGLWIELIGYMHEADPYGHLTINGATPSIEDIAALVGRPMSEVRKAMAELRERQVFSEATDGPIFSRRMVRDKAKADQDAANGKGGGNPKLTAPDNGGVNPPLKAQIPEARIQKESAAPSPDLEKQLYDRGKEVLGEKSGGLVKNLLKAKGGDLALARAAIETASTKSNPRDYIGAIVKAKPREGEFVWNSGIPGVI